MLWLWLDRQFFNDVVVRGWRPAAAPAPAAEPAPALAAGVVAPVRGPVDISASSAAVLPPRRVP